MRNLPPSVDVGCLVLGMIVLRRTFSRKPFVVGFVFMLLCLRPAFDFGCESIALLSGDGGDLYAIQNIIGSGMTWTSIAVSLGLSILTVVTILRRLQSSGAIIRFR